jgi:hypothetical protein
MINQTAIGRNPTATGRNQPFDNRKDQNLSELGSRFSALQILPYFKDVLLKSLCEQDSLQWRRWYVGEKAELAKLPT